MIAIGTHITDGDATPDPVRVDFPCRRIILRQNLNDITAGFTVYAPGITSAGMPCAEGEQWTFDAGSEALFQVGAIVGYTKTVNAGPFTFYKKHE